MPDRRTGGKPEICLKPMTWLAEAHIIVLMVTNR